MSNVLLLWLHRRKRVGEIGAAESEGETAGDRFSFLQTGALKVSKKPVIEFTMCYFLVSYVLCGWNVDATLCGSAALIWPLNLFSLMIISLLCNHGRKSF